MEYVGLVFALFVPSQNNTLSPTTEQASRVKAHCLLPLRNEVQEWNSEQKRLETASCLRCFLIAAREGSQASSWGRMTGLGRKGPSLPL